MLISRLPLLAAFVFVFATPSLAHEFWISPVNYTVESGGQVQADLRVGQLFRGSAYSYQPRQFERFETVLGDTAKPVSGRLGDTPAMSVDDAQDGLMIVVHETTDSLLTYREWAKFEKFVAHKAFDGVLEDHVTRGIPKEGFAEAYRRYAKSLIAVGDGSGSDREVGMRTEIVALKNPYRDVTDSLPVKVLLDGQIRPNAQVELFEKAPDGVVEVTLHRTDELGVATLPMKPGYSYLADAVVLEPLANDDPEKGPVWKSLWAALTFAVPESPLK